MEMQVTNLLIFTSPRLPFVRRAFYTFLKIKLHKIRFTEVKTADIETHRVAFQRVSRQKLMTSCCCANSN